MIRTPNSGLSEPGAEGSVLEMPGAPRHISLHHGPGLRMAQIQRSALGAFFRQLGRRGRAGAADYFFQVIIVILGVYLGITFEAKASDYDRTHKAKAALRYVVRDMRRDEADMSRVIQEQRAQARDYEEIADWLAPQASPVSARIDSLLRKVTTSPTVFPRRGAYSSMIAAGQLALLSEDTSDRIANLYENVYVRLAANGEHYDYSLERDFFPAYARAWDPARHELIAHDAGERTRFRNVVLLMHAWSQYYGGLVSESQRELQVVLADIDD